MTDEGMSGFLQVEILSNTNPYAKRQHQQVIKIRCTDPPRDVARIAGQVAKNVDNQKLTPSPPEGAICPSA